MEKAQVLIVEDDAIIAMDIESQVKQLGYGVSAIVGYGEQAVEKVKENAPDLVLMDIILKGEMDGIEAAEEIHTLFGIPVIFLTAYADKDRLKRAKLTHPFGFILKPFQNKDLEVTIEMALYVAKVDAERKKAEKVLKESEKRFRITAKETGQLLYSFDPKTGKVKWAGAVEAVTGYTYEEFQSFDVDAWAEHIHLDDRKMVLKTMDKALERHTRFDAEYRFQRKDGSYIFVEEHGAFVTDDQSTPYPTVGTISNITERKQAEEALRESEAKYRSMMAAMIDASYICSPDFRVEYMNPAMIKMTGRDATGELCYKAINDLDERCPWCIHDKIQQGGSVRIEIVSPKDNRYYHVSNSPIFHGDGSISNMAIFRDITEIEQRKE